MTQPTPPHLSGSPVLPLASRVWAALHPFVQLWSGENPVHPAGLRPRTTVRGGFALAGDDPCLYRRTCPLVTMVAEVLSVVLRWVDVLTESGEPAPVNAFSLRHQESWAQPTRDPLDVLNYVAGPCRIRCAFCYLKGNPPSLRRIHRVISDEEFRYRLALFRRGLVLFPKNVLSTDEQTTSPRLTEALEVIREVTGAPLFLESNGVGLTPAVVRTLAKAAPVFVNLSVNSLNPAVRRRVLCDPVPGRIERAVDLLREWNVPFSASVVPWPGIPLEDLEATLSQMAAQGATHVRVRLPAHTATFHPRPLFHLEEFWDQILACVEALRPRLACPLLVEPSKYEQLKRVRHWELPVVLGVVARSPAALAGVREGDYVCAVNGVPMAWRSDGLRALVRLAANAKDAVLDLRRGEQRLRVHLTFTPRDAPPFFASDPRTPYGMFLCDDLDRRAALRVRSLLAHHRPARPLLITSWLMERSALALLDLYGIRAQFPQLSHAVIPNRYFGGHVRMGDLLVADDVVRFLREQRGTQGRPDLVMLPGSAFNELGRDLLGYSYRRIVHETGIPVALIPTHTITL